MDLIIKPYHSRELYIIDADESFTESFDYEVACNNTYYFKLDLISTLQMKITKRKT